MELSSKYLFDGIAPSAAAPLTGFASPSGCVGSPWEALHPQHNFLLEGVADGGAAC